MCLMCWLCPDQLVWYLESLECNLYIWKVHSKNRLHIDKSFWQVERLPPVSHQNSTIVLSFAKQKLNASNLTCNQNLLYWQVSYSATKGYSSCKVPSPTSCGWPKHIIQHQCIKQTCLDRCKILKYTDSTTKLCTSAKCTRQLIANAYFQKYGSKLRTWSINYYNT